MEYKALAHSASELHDGSVGCTRKEEVSMREDTMIV